MEFFVPSLSDAKSLADLERSCFSTPYSEKDFENNLKNPTLYRFFAIREGKTIVGYLGCYTVLDETFITNLCVLPSFRRLGIATQLLQKAFDFCKDNQVLKIMLEVRSSNVSAIALYQKMGFLQTGVSKNHYHAPTEDALLMTKDF